MLSTNTTQPSDQQHQKPPYGVSIHPRVWARPLNRWPSCLTGEAIFSYVVQRFHST
jgi:hypothetical protein